MIIAIITALIYSNTLTVPFVYDDVINISKNSSLAYYCSWTGIKGWQFILNSRSVGLFSLCINYRLNGLNVTGYHIVNTGIHIANAILIYFLILLIYKSPFIQSFKPTTNVFTPKLNAFLVAVLFAAHPIQTQSVIYIIQRYNLLAAFFMLSSLITYFTMLSSADKSKRIIYYIISMIFMFFAVKSKEQSVLLPFLIIMIHLTLYHGTLKEAIINNIIPLLIAMIMPLGIYLTAPGTLGELGIIKNSTQLEDVTLNTTSSIYYLFTQFTVMVTYIRLLLLPIHKAFQYDYPFYKSFFNVNVLLSFIFLVSVILLGIYTYYLSYKKNMQLYRLLFIGIYWFFLFLSLHSTIIPFNDLIVEHWLYLPSIGFIIFMVTLSTILAGKMAKKYINGVLFGLVLLIIVSSIVSYKRNIIWQSEISLWQDVVNKHPGYARGHFTLGLSYLNHGDYYKAIEEIEKSIILYNNRKTIFQSREQLYLYLGVSFRKIGIYHRAIDALINIIPMRDSYSNSQRGIYIDAYNELGLTYLDMNNYEMALDQFINALKLNNNEIKTRINLGNLFIKMNEIDKAIVEFQFVAYKNPSDIQVHTILRELFREKYGVSGE
ncbi:MAG: tetratricopeptide repeat protein [Nitrospirae bacterium]|nr:tetratricopeptide repeat protein [Nitrospirota bacterium]